MRLLSLQRLLLIFFTITAILPLFVFSFYQEMLFSQFYKQHAVQALSKIADKKINNITYYFDKRLNDLKILSRSPFTQDAFDNMNNLYLKEGISSKEYKQLEQSYHKFFQQYYEYGYYDMFFISLDKTVFFSLMHEDDFGANLESDILKHTGLADAVDNSFRYLNPSISTFEYYEPSNKYSAFIAVPAIYNGVLQGVIALQLKIADIHDIISDDTALGKTGETVTASFKHTHGSIQHEALFTSPLKSKNFLPFTKQLNFNQENDKKYKAYKALELALKGQYGSGITRDFRNKKVIATWRYIPVLQWGLVVKKDLSEVLEPVENLYDHLLIIFFILLALVILISIFLGRKLVLPLKLLEQNISSMIEEKSLLPVQVKGYQESRQLAVSFNKMSAQVLEYQYTLEDQVKERTQELQRASLVIATTKQAIVITDLQPKIIEVNQAYVELFGYSEEELIGRNPNILSSKRASTQFYKEMWSDLKKYGHWSGEVWNRKKSGEFIPVMMNTTTVTDKDNNPINYVAILTNIEVLKSHQDQLHKLAYYDTLTKLPNRMLMQDRLFHDIAIAKRNKTQLAVMFLDLDRFKIINDSLGHNAGDKLLQIIASRIKETIRDNDTVSRLGGDEFVVILDNIESLADAAHIAQKIINSISKAIDIRGQNVFVGASIGISFYPDDADSVEILLKHADVAMYKAKENGKGNFQFYSDILDKDSLFLLKMEDELRTAIINNQLCLYYQPQFNCMTGEICGLEALIRWFHPEKGLIPPNTFIPIAESTGLIGEIDKWVLNNTCLQLQKWSSKGILLFKTAVNLSGRHFENPKLTQNLMSLLEHHKVKAEYLELEITERMLVKDPDKALKVMKEIDQLGIKISIDDFGTGYSSLSYLKRFPITTLKIDKSFIDGIPGDSQDVAITHAIMNLAKNLGMKVLAEGVETEQQNMHLTEQGCDEIQGYFYSKPLSAEELEQKWLKA